jgi:predicted nucleotidyltransferase
MTAVQERLALICRRFGVTSLYVFGSRAGEIAARCSGQDAVEGAAPRADVDIAVQPAVGALVSARDRVALADELEELFQVSRVDLVLLPRASAFLAADAIRGELLYCEDEDRQSREELYYLRRAGDLAPLQQERLQGLLTGELHR